MSVAPARALEPSARRERAASRLLLGRLPRLGGAGGHGVLDRTAQLVVFQFDAEHLRHHPARQLAVQLLVLGKADIGILIVDRDDLRILRIVLQMGARELQQMVLDVALLRLARPAAGSLAGEDARQREDRRAPFLAQLAQQRHQFADHAPVVLWLESRPLGELFAQDLDLAHQAVEGLLLLAERRGALRRDAQLLRRRAAWRRIEEVRLRMIRRAYRHRLTPT